MDETVQNGNFHLEAKKKPCNFTPTKQKISEANYNVYNSSKKQTKQIWPDVWWYCWVEAVEGLGTL